MNKSVIKPSPTRVNIFLLEELMELKEADDIARDGCSGRIVFEHEDGIESAFLQLMGIRNANGDFDAEFRRRIPSGEVLVVTRNKALKELVQRLPFCNLSEGDDVKELVAVDTKFLLIHGISNVKRLIQPLLRDKSAINVVVALFREEIKPNNHPLRPKQSYELIDGEWIGPFSQLQAVASYFHEYATRTDSCKTFSVKENGGNGTINAYHFLFELAYKLQLTPKYGA